MCIAEEALRLEILYGRDKAVNFLIKNGYSKDDAEAKIDRLVKEYLNREYDEINTGLYN